MVTPAFVERFLEQLPFTRQARRRVYLEALPRHLAAWQAFRTQAGEGLEEVTCSACPKFDAGPARCTVPFGSKLRACICASTELALRETRNLHVLEIGCGESSFARRVVETSGGRWVGLDPRAEKAGRASVRSICGLVQHLPFADASFDVICGTQTLEHWEDPLVPWGKLGYASTLAEIWRVLRPGGWIYFDAPMHLHGAAEFIRGDLPAIRAIFTHQAWSAVRLLSWRRLHQPLAPHFAPAHERARWSAVLHSEPEELTALQAKPAWILAVRASKPASAPAAAR